MLSFFPVPYPDELLYSTLARYHVRSGNISAKATLEELFGRTTASAVFDLPCNLDTLVKNLPKCWGYKTADFIYDHTLYPLYAPFMPAQRSDQILEAMRGDTGGTIHTQTGIMASAIKENRYFKFCPKCSMEDKAKYGELYWHRLHQVPGVLICPLHKQILLDSSVPIRGQNKHEFYAALEVNCPVKPRAINISDKALNHLNILATDIEWVLLNKLSPSQDLNWHRERYLSILIHKGLASCRGRVYTNELINSLVEFFGHEFLEAVQSPINRNDGSNWLLSIVRKHRKCFHPIRHLLMMEFLAGSAKKYFQNDYEYKPFGEGPWPCLNAAAKHYFKPVVTDLIVTYCADTKRPVGTFSCDCGFIYSRRGPDQTENDRYRIGRVKNFGSEWEEKLHSLLALKDLSYREIARRLKVDTNTVIKYSKAMENTSEPKIEIQASQEQGFYRNQWLELRTENPTVSKTSLRKLNQAAYSWLYRHDKDWLNENSLLASRYYNNTRVDWELRDRQILNQVKKCVDEEMLSPNAPRMTIGRIGRKINRLGLLQQHINKLPLTKAYLETVCESIDDYQIRRIVKVSRQLRAEGVCVKVWKVVRIAAIRPGYSSVVGEVLQQEENIGFSLLPLIQTVESDLYLN